MLSRLQFIERHNHMKPMKIESYLWPAYNVVPAGITIDCDAQQVRLIGVPGSRFEQLSDYAKQMGIIKDIRARMGHQEVEQSEGLVTIKWEELNKEEQSLVNSDSSFDP